MNVSFPIYVIGLVSFLSWFLFTIFGGIGLAAVPLDLIRTFNARPRKFYTKDEIDKMRLRLVKESLIYKENLENFQQENSSGRANKACNKYISIYLFSIKIFFYRMINLFSFFLKKKERI